MHLFRSEVTLECTGPTNGNSSMANKHTSSVIVHILNDILYQRIASFLRGQSHKWTQIPSDDLPWFGFLVEQRDTYSTSQLDRQTYRILIELREGF